MQHASVFWLKIGYLVGWQSFKHQFWHHESGLMTIRNTTARIGSCSDFLALHTVGFRFFGYASVRLTDKDLEKLGRLRTCFLFWGKFGLFSGVIIVLGKVTFMLYTKVSCAKLIELSCGTQSSSVFQIKNTCTTIGRSVHCHVALPKSTESTCFPLAERMVAACNRSFGWNHTFQNYQELRELHPGKLTWQWKNNYLKLYILLKMVIFHCHVSFRGCNH